MIGIGEEMIAAAAGHTEGINHPIMWKEQMATRVIVEPSGGGECSPFRKI
jgi:hypothetical protein